MDEPQCSYHPGTVDVDLICHGRGVSTLEDFWSCCMKDIGSYGQTRKGRFDNRPENPRDIPGCVKVDQGHTWEKEKD